MNLSLDGKVAVVTGGSRGIGAATVRLFAGAGAKIVFSYDQAAGAAQKVIKSCGPHAPSVVAIHAELSRMADARRLIAEALRRFGRLDILVANAGIWNESADAD